MNNSLRKFSQSLRDLFFIQRQRFYFLFILVFSLTIIFLLSLSTYYINFWPSDSYTPYIPTARRLFEKPFLSEMHDLPIDGLIKITMHGKEALILGIAVMQRILNDFQSLYPNVFLLIISIGISSILFYTIFSKFFGREIGILASLLFMTCFGPYMYCLQGAHQPLVLLNFLFTVFFLFCFKESNFSYLLSGIFFGFMLFSSPTAPLYFPYFLGFYLWKIMNENSSATKIHSFPYHQCLIFGLGVLGIFLLFTFPHCIKNIKDYSLFIRASQSGNNFVIYQSYLSRYFPLPESLRGEGFVWIFKYFFLIMPIMFPWYIVSLLYLIKTSLQKIQLLYLCLISLSTPLLAEWVGVAQFGRNYFSWIVGLIFLICLAAYHFEKNLTNKKVKLKFLGSLIGLFLLHLIFNLYIFSTDVFPTRLATTRIHHWLRERNIKRIYVYFNHPLNLNFVQFLNNPKQKEEIKFYGMDNIRQAQEGYILIPPITGKTIFKECRYTDFTLDPYLTELYHSSDFKKYVAASFKTMATSKIWVQEEEICTYLDLIIKGIDEKDRKKGYVYILDASKLQKEWFAQFPKILPIR